MGRASPDPQAHLLGSAVAAYDTNMFRDDFLPPDVISSEWNPLVVVEHNVQNVDDQFNYEMRM